MGRKSNASIEDDVKKVKGLEIHGKALRLNFSYRGVRCRETLNLPLTKNNIKYAANLLSAIRYQISTNTFNYAETFPDSKASSKFGHMNSNITFEEQAKKWLDGNVELTQAVRERYEDALKLINAELGKILIAHMSLETISSYRAKLIVDLKARTANYRLSIVKRVLKSAYENKLMVEDKSKWVKLYTVSKVEPDPFSQEEFKSLIGGCVSIQDKIWLTVAVWTGLRTGEQCALAWEDVDLDKGTALIRRNVTSRHEFKETKTNREREIVLMPPALEALKRQYELTGAEKPRTVEVKLKELKRTREDNIRFVFRPNLTRSNASKYFCYNPQGKKINWAKIVSRTDVRYRSQYQTRHTFACWALTYYGNPVFVAKQLGHRDFTEIVNVYGTWMPEESKPEANKIWEFYRQKFPNDAPLNF